ncbi:MAG: hypothetical protein ACK5LP_06410 [Campylobacteraceae bacterium]
MALPEILPFATGTETAKELAEKLEKKFEQQGIILDTEEKRNLSDFCSLLLGLMTENSKLLTSDNKLVLGDMKNGYFSYVDTLLLMDDNKDKFSSLENLAKFYNFVYFLKFTCKEKSLHVKVNLLSVLKKSST